jgi:hypothetical protein
MLTAYIFCLGDLDEVIESTATLWVCLSLCVLKCTGSVAGAATMAMIIWVLGVCCLVGFMAGHLDKCGPAQETTLFLSRRRSPRYVHTLPL